MPPRLRVLSLLTPLALLAAWEAAAPVHAIDVRFFPAPSLAGVLTIDRIYLDVGRAYGARGAAFLRTIALPGALPVVFAGSNWASALR